ncbi:ATP-binding response regulator [Desulfogranum mediterraneum]|uniref:ATP-binding response regulator n=1 Tax=Desulfogranum mediterraneum TaxID=160661 RepID=UPI0004037D1B|nr:response regulator [Desulfogranum mediterraneum]
MTENSGRPHYTGDILALDDIPANLQLLTDILTRAGYKVRPTKKPHMAIEAAQARPPDLILLDVKMPEMDGFEVCRRLKEDQRTREIPIIFVTALQRIDDRIRGFEAGGVDFITKPYQEAEILARIKTHMELRGIQKHLERLVSERTAELQEALEAMGKSEARYKSLFDDASDMIHIIGQDGVIIDANPIELQTLGYSREEYIGTHFLEIVHPDNREKTAAALRQVMSGKTVNNHEAILVAKDGSLVYVEVNAVPQVEQGRILSSRGIMRDITERKREEEKRVKLEEQLRQTQRLEAIGTLAGGIAHDFNNLLSPILGYSEMVQQEQPQESRDWQRLQLVINAGYRAKDLVQQVLTFSRVGEYQRQPISVHHILKEALKLLRASIPATVKFSLDIKDVSSVVYADPTQIHQLIVNLCTNAAQAMQESGGILGISSTAVEVAQDDGQVAGLALTPGRYLRLEVSDTGYGMDRPTLERIFEPYFTTRKNGKGTGLGLAIVHGIVKSHGGHITVHSEPGEGTTFQVYLPRVCSEDIEAAAPGSEKKKALPQGNERLLVVDDEKLVAELYKETLQELGYTVTAMSDSKKALAAYQSSPDDFDLVLTDQTMPDLTGAELAAEIVNIRPGTPVILCSGYSGKDSENRVKELGISSFLVKPVSSKVLATTIRKILDKS